MSDDQQPQSDDQQHLSDEPLPPFEIPNLADVLPLEGDNAEEGSRAATPIPVAQFKYIGKGLTADAFSHYVATYDFGPQPPDFVVLHHTAIPSTKAAPYPSGWRWDNDEQGMTDGQIYRKRLKLLEMMREFYRVQNCWDRGPHLYIDDRWIWLFTPMFDQGIHAAQGNGYRDSTGRLRYSIGIEVCGYFEHVTWSEPVARLTSHAIAALKKRLNNFEIKHTKYSGGISSHRDYNKPSCPGAAITESYYLGVIRDSYSRLTNPSASAPVATGPITVNAPLLGPPTGRRDQIVKAIRAQLPASSEYQRDIEAIIDYYWIYGPSVGLDPFLAAAQCVFETGGLTSGWSARPKRNPAGLGVRQEGGLSFESWDKAIQAHIGQLLAFALRDDEANEAQRKMMELNPRHAHIKPELRGSAKTLAGLNSRWTDDGDYASKLVNRAEAIRTM